MDLKIPPLRRPSARVLRRVHALDPEYHGKIAAIEPKSGRHFIADNVLEAVRKTRRHFPKAVFYAVRIGFDAVDFQGGGILQAQKNRSRKCPSAPCF